GDHQDHPDRVPDPAHVRSEADADRTGPQQDASHRGTDGHPRGARHDPQGAAYGIGRGL
ncbi:MAG: LSU ribosomal protein L30p (L7e), partial [uncultured Sphingosinicella sp.]